MNIKTILKKLLAKEELTADEKAFAEQFDLQKEIDTASAAARRKAEEKAKEATDKLTAQNAAVKELQDKLDAAETALAEAKGGNSKEMEALTKKVAKLEAINAENEKTLKANARIAAIREAAKANGITAAKGVSEAALERLIDLAVGDTDTADAEALKGVLETFKKDNPAMIAAEVKNGASVKGGQTDNTFAGVANPWKAESFNLTKQCEISTANPQLAEQMQKEAGASAT